MSTVIGIFNLDTGLVARTLETHGLPIRSMAFSPASQLLASATWESTRVWDLATGNSILSLPTNGRINRVAFDSTGSYLVTDAGDIALVSDGKEDEIPARGSRPHPRGYNFVPEGWLAYNEEKILWLPPEYRPRQVAVAGSTVALACLGGRLLILELRADRLV